MDALNQFSELAISSLKTTMQMIGGAIPKILGAIVLLLIGWLIAKIASYVVAKILKAIKLNNAIKKLNEIPMIKNSSFEIDGVKIISKFVYWILLLIFIITATDTMGWPEVSAMIAGLIAYLPKLLSALVIFLLGFYIANLIKGLVHTTLHTLEVSSASVVSNAVFYILLIFIAVTALNQAGMDTTMITSNVTMILGAVMLAFTISFGLGSRDILTNILSSIYGKKNFEVGDHVKIGNIRGEIIKIDNISVTVKTPESDFVIPAQKLVSEQVEKFK
ncbi:MAG: mechanosensitive ion channel family protein [Cyclobacteriaceae bacterium]